MSREEMRGKEFKVLDQGFIRVIDWMGSDQRVVEAARLTAQSDGKGEMSDRNLLRYLMRQRHSTPVEFCELVLHIRLPMDAHRQHVRHRMATINEYSTRYTEAIDACQQTPPDQWRRQSTSNRQGSSSEFVQDWPEGYELDGQLLHKPVKDAWGNTVRAETVDVEVNLRPGDYLSGRENEFHKSAKELYGERLAFGVAKEQARKDLPLSNYTELYWKIDLHNLLHYLSLRMDSHAQLEIRSYANVIGEEIVAKLFPMTWEAFCDYRLEAVTLTALDQICLQVMIGSGCLAPHSLEMFVRSSDAVNDWTGKAVCRERDECLVKFRKLGLVQQPK